MKIFTIQSSDLFNPDYNPTMRFDVAFASLVKDITGIIDANTSYTPESATELLEGIMASSAAADKHRSNEFGQHITVSGNSKLSKFIVGLTECTTKAEAVAYARQKLGFNRLTEAQEASFVSFIENIIEYRCQAAKKRLDEQKARVDGLINLMR